MSRDSAHRSAPASAIDGTPRTCTALSSALSFFAVHIHVQIVGLIQPHSMQPGAIQLSCQPVPNCDRQVFRCGNFVAKLRYLFIEVTMIEHIDYLAVHDVLELLQVHYKARARVHLSRDCDLQGVVMSVPMRIVALAENALVF